MKSPPPETFSVDQEELDGLLERLRSSDLVAKDYELLRELVASYAFLTEAIGEKGARIAQLRKLLFGSASEKTRQVLEEVLGPQASSTEEKSSADQGKKKPKRRRKGHGRNGNEAYRGAERIKVSNESLRPGDPCPLCPKGKTYKLKKPQRLVRLTGQAPIHARIVELERLRCNLCGEIFTAKTPEGLGEEKYDAKSSAMIALLRYGSGLPFNRLESLQESLGIPLPDATQWDIVEKTARQLVPAYEQLIVEAAQGDVMHNDDTRMPILEVMKLIKDQTSRGSPPDRTGMFTSGIVSTKEGRQIALFFTGRKHAGENLSAVLAKRAQEIRSPIQMCDGLDRNLPKGLPEELEVIVSNCLVHARRHFIKVAQSFPEECAHVLHRLGEVYKIDAQAKKQGLDPTERLRLHQRESAPIMDKLQKWLSGLLEEKKVEPNSGLGKAINYALPRWQRLTLFLREPGAPLDNNAVERVLKKAIVHRKNSLFYKTQNGAKVGDLFMSFIVTCQLSGTNPLDYLTQLQDHAAELADNPVDWMPWNYPATPEPTAE